MLKRFIILIVILVVVFGGIFGYDAMRNHYMNQYFDTMKMPASTISTAKSTLKTYVPTLHAVGSVVAVNGTTISTQTSGQVTAIHFKSGQQVEKGQLLVSLDSVIDQNNLARDQAKLNLDLITYHRTLKLYKRHAVSVSALDTARANVQQDLANVRTDNYNIHLKNIRAPFSGVAGIREVSLGQYLQVGAPIVSLQSITSLYVNFALPEQDLNKVKVGQKIKLNVDSQPGKNFMGEVTAINSTVSPNTRNINVQATVSNKQHLLYPGLFASVNMLLPAKKNVLMVPQTAVSYSLYGDTVYVVQKKGKGLIAVQHVVKVGDPAPHDQVVILSGLKPNQTVVNSGQNKLHDYAPVKINNTVKLN